jgi:hypothetical protein
VVPIDAGRARSADAAPAGFRNPRGLSHRDEREVPGPRRGRRAPAADKTSVPADAGSRSTDGAHTSAADTDPAASGTGAPPPRRQDLVRALIRASAPSTRTTLPANRQHPDVAVLAPIADGYPALAATLQSASVPHLAVEVHETTGVLGPFVHPGRTSCLRCRDLYRTARDPGWPRAMVPFGGVDAVPAVEDRACDVMLATLVAVQAALHVLAWIEGDPPPTVNAMVEVVPPFGAQTRHERPPHPDCGCLVAGIEPAGAEQPPLVRR